MSAAGRILGNVGHNLEAPFIEQRTILGRIKAGMKERLAVEGADSIRDMYISGGENVYPAEVEAVLTDHEAVLEATVLGVPDARWGEAGHAVVRLRPGASCDAETPHVFTRSRLAAYKVPKHVTIVDDYPRKAAGKVQNHVLRRTLLSQAG